MYCLASAAFWNFGVSQADYEALVSCRPDSQHYSDCQALLSAQGVAPPPLPTAATESKHIGSI